MKKALALDPLSPEINSFLAWDYYLKRDYSTCIAPSLKAMQMFPDFWLPHMAAGMCYYIRSRSFSRRMRGVREGAGDESGEHVFAGGVAMCLAKRESERRRGGRSISCRR